MRQLATEIVVVEYGTDWKTGPSAVLNSDGFEAVSS